MIINCQALYVGNQQRHCLEKTQRAQDGGINCKGIADAACKPRLSC